MVPVSGLAQGHGPTEFLPFAARGSTAGLDALRRQADLLDAPAQRPGDPAGINRLRRGKAAPVTGPRTGVIRRAPIPTETKGLFSDPDAPGFLFISTGQGNEHDNEYVIKGSKFKVYWNAEQGRWLSPEGYVVVFEDATEKKSDAKVPTRDSVIIENPQKPGKPGKSEKPARKPTRDDRDKKPQKNPDKARANARGQVPPRKSGNKENPLWIHYSLEMEDFVQLGLGGMMSKIRELADSFQITTPIEKYWNQTKPRDKGTFYRYHKFSMLPSGQQDLVFGGGINKTEITPEWQRDNLKVLLSERFNLLKSLKSEVGPVQAAAMEIFQANAMTTPFIATTSNLEYAEKLFTQYPPTAHQHAVILVIEGPMSHAFDFEKEFAALGKSQGGQAKWNFRSREDRAKDADQLEFGLPDLYIPMKGVSPYGFHIVKVIECGLPPQVGLGPLLANDPSAVIVREQEVTLVSNGSASQGDGTSDKKD